MIKLLAVFITLTASSMTAVAAWDRGGTVIDKALLVSMSVVIVIAVHLLPALSRRPAAWLVWAGCLLCAIYGHLTFLIHASQRAGDNLAQHSSLSVGTERQIEITREALAQIKARPVATVAAELAQESDKRTRAALTVEIAEGKKAEALRDGLVKLSGVSTEAQVTGAADPATAKLAAATGLGESTISVVIGLTFSMLIELIGALVWVEALRSSRVSSVKVATVTTNVTPVTSSAATPVTTDVTESVTIVAGNETPHTTTYVSDHVTTLQEAIKFGECKGTVASIREFLGCSQSKAMELRRELASAT